MDTHDELVKTFEVAAASMAADPSNYVGNLPLYQSHKRVRAVKFVVVEYAGPNRQWLILEDGSKIERSTEWMDKHQPKAPGYLVVYDDGYESYSPVKAFEEGYTRITETPPDDQITQTLADIGKREIDGG